jgi:hypothetical protein
VVQGEKKTTLRYIILFSVYLIIPAARSIASYCLSILRLNHNKSVANSIAVFVEFFGTEPVFGGPEEKLQLFGRFESVEHKLNGLLVVTGQDFGYLESLRVVPVNNSGFLFSSKHFHGIGCEKRPAFV